MNNEDKLIESIQSEEEVKINIHTITNEICDFIKERDWDKFHTPKNLATSISIEANELLEIFQWESLTFDEIRKDKRRIKSISSEIADIQIYVLELMNNLGLSLEQVVREKIQSNKEKYPPDKCRGKADKYHSYM